MAANSLAEHRAETERRWFYTVSRRFLVRVAFTLGGLAIVFGGWQLSHLVVGQFCPTPRVVFNLIARNFLTGSYFNGLGLNGGYLPHLLSTTGNVLAGVAIGGLIGTPIGWACAFSDVLRKLISPITTAAGTIPILAIAPFFLMWFGVGSGTKLALVAFYSAFLFQLFAFRSILNVPPALMEYAYTLGASRMRAFLKVACPASLPELFAGFRLALTGGWGLAAITELLGTNWGIGRVIMAGWGVNDISIIIGSILLLSVSAIAADAVLLAVRRWVLRWSTSAKELA